MSNAQNFLEQQGQDLYELIYKDMPSLLLRHRLLKYCTVSSQDVQFISEIMLRDPVATMKILLEFFDNENNVYLIGEAMLQNSNLE